MPLPVRIAIVTTDAQLAFHLQLRLQSKGYQATSLSEKDGVLGACYSDPPDLLIFDFSADSGTCIDIITTLRSDSFFSAIPILGLVAQLDCDTFIWETCPLDDFVYLPINFSELFCRISLSLSRIKRIFDNNPLSRLPGNTSIQRAIEEVIGKPMAVCYLDINHFKPYNDAYGFSHGDEVLRMLSRIMFNAVRDSGGGFTGHIGGDDFVFIVPHERSIAVCQTIINYFDQIMLDLFDEETKAQGFFYGINRKGEGEQIPLLSISIAVVPMDSPSIQHYAKVAEVAAELKKMAKDSNGSRYVVDQRRS
ncbi:MAG: diguanylate cyclase response regulator [Geobacter sp.]|nr:MAG: diguanylate cyclase response regulator [Geobacter sp.]